MLRIVLPFVVAPILLGLGPSASAQEVPNRLEEDNTLTQTYTTPHVPWGKGYVKGKVRALFFLRGVRGDKSWIAAGSCGRPAVELAQRFDIESQVVYMALGEALHGTKGEERSVRLMEKPYDVFITTIPLQSLRAKTQYFILSQVRDGAGLVCFGPPAKEVMTEDREMGGALDPFLTSGSALTFLPNWHNRSSETSVARRLLKCYQLGDGRGVRVVGWPGGPYGAPKFEPTAARGALAQYDYWALFCGRIILWAAGKEADLSITNFLGGASSIPRAELPKGNLPVSLRSSHNKRLKLDVETALTRDDGWEASLPTKAVETGPRGKASLSVEIPRLRPGRYAFRAIARSERGTEGFGASSFTVTSPVNIKSVSLDEDSVERGETISGSIELPDELPAGLRLLLRLRDSYDRVLAEKALAPAAAEAGKIPFSIATNEWATILMRAQAVLADEGGEVAVAEATFNAPHRRRGRFNFVMWDFPHSPLGYHGALRLRDGAGFSVSLSQIPHHPMVAACNMPYIPYTTRVQSALDENGVMKPVCWNDDAAADRYVNEIAEKYEPARKHGVFLYSLGDEVSTSGCCLSAPCLRAYRKYLGQQYGTVEALNNSWGSNYASLSEVTVLKDGDNLEKEALQQGRFARWYDRQAFARYNMAQFCARFHRAFKKRDPHAITGFEGAGRFGDDYDLIVETNGFWSPYPSIGDEVLRSLAPRGYVHGNWTGYSRNAGSLIARNWRAITRGYDSIWWWRWDGAGRWRGYLNPNLDFWPATQELTDEMKIVREGLGDLLIHCEMPHCGVALYYSMPSYFSNNLQKSDAFAKYRDVHATWICATLDNQMPFRYTTPKRVQRGDLKSGGYKVLVLPFTQAVGAEEAKAFREFVEAGGTLIADLRPGVFDAHCKPQSPGALDDLFGIKRTAREGATEISGSLDVKLGEQPLKLSLDKTTADRGVEAGGAKPLAVIDGVPLLLSQKVGKGTTLLLNFAPQDAYPKERQFESSDSTRLFVRALYESAGVRSPVVVKARGETPVRATEISLFRTGDIELMSVTTTRAEDPAFAHDLTVQLDEEKEVYDLRSRKYLGRTREFSATLRVGRATFFALLPYRAETFTASLTPEALSPGDVATLDLTLSNAVGKEGTTAAFIEGLGPDGRTLPYLRDVVLLRNGSGTFRFPIAHNHPPGALILRATELLSGRTVEVKCEVGP